MTTMYLSTTQLNMKYMKRGEAKLEKLTTEVVTGGQQVGYGGKNVKVFLDQEINLPALEAYKTGNALGEGRLSLMSDQVGFCQTMAIEIQKQISLVVSTGNLGALDISTYCQDCLDRIESFLNVQFNGDYVFSGTATETPPAPNVSSMASPPTGAGPNTSYYMGNNGLYTLQADDTLSINCNVNASNPGFEELIRSLLLFKDAVTSPPDMARLTQAQELCNQATIDLINAGGQINLARQQIAKSTDNTLEQIVETEGNIKTLGYKNQSDTIGDYFQEKMALELSREIVMQTYASLQKLADAVRK